MISHGNRALHQSRARKAWPYLAERANLGGPPFTYKQIGELIGVHWRAVGWFLGEIQDYCHRSKLPPLQALVVQSTTGLPGGGYHGSARTYAEHEHAVAAVHAHEWAKTPPNFS